MTAITASMVKELRELTGAGMMECKKALVDAEGDIQTAIDNMRKSGQAKAAKKAGRIAAEGAIVIAVNDNKTYAKIYEINCETDFVARDENFKTFVKQLSECGLSNLAKDVTDLMTYKMPNSELSAEECREALIVKIGENIQVRRMDTLEAEGAVGSYLHGDRIGVIVAIDQPNEALARDIAMHIAASNPAGIEEKDIPAAVIEKEREIARAQSEETGKPANIIEKMVDGRIQKFMKEVCLIHQPFVKETEITIGQLLAKHKAHVTHFVRYEVGEGIEKETVDLAKEVSATLQGNR